MKILFLVVLVAVWGSCYGGHVEHDHCDICEEEDFAGFGTPASKCGCCPWPCCCKCFDIPIHITICKKVLDISWVLDSSGSIGPIDWVVAKQFVNDVHGELKGIGKTQKVSMVTYSTNATLEWCFEGEQSSSKEDLIEAVDSLKLQGYFTNTVEGLEKAYYCLDSDENRKKAPNVCIVMTDGRTTHRLDELSDMSAKFQSKCDQVVVIGVTTSVSTDELNTIAGPNGKVFQVEKYEYLIDILDHVRKEICRDKEIETETKCFCCCTPEQFFGGGGAYYYSY